MYFDTTIALEECVNIATTKTTTTYIKKWKLKKKQVCIEKMKRKNKTATDGELPTC